MADGASLDMLSRLPQLAETESPLTTAAREAIAPLTEPQRLALAIQIVLGASETASRLQLRRLITAANRVTLELGAKALERGEL